MGSDVNLTLQNIQVSKEGMENRKRCRRKAGKDLESVSKSFRKQLCVAWELLILAPKPMRI